MIVYTLQENYLNVNKSDISNVSLIPKKLLKLVTLMTFSEIGLSDLFHGTLLALYANHFRTNVFLNFPTYQYNLTIVVIHIFF